MKKFIFSILAVFAACLCVNAEIWITGNATSYGWTTGHPAGSQLTDNGDGTFSWEGDMNVGNFRFLTTGDWWNESYSVDGDANIDVAEGEYPFKYYPQKLASGKEPSFNLTKAGKYKVTLNMETMKMTLTLVSGLVAPDLWLVGDATPAGWSTDNSKNYKMAKDDLTYTWTGPLTKHGDGRFVFLASEGQWWPRYTNGIDARCLEMAVGQSYDIKRFEGNADSPAMGVEKPGIYTVTVTISDDMQSGTVTIEEAEICIIGPAVSGGWVFGDISKNEFVSDGEGRYTFTGNLSNAADEGKFRINQKGKWSPAFFPVQDGTAIIPAHGGTFDARWWPSDNVPHFQIEGAGNYTLVMDLTNTYTKPTLIVTYNEPVVEKPLTELYICGNAMVEDGNPVWELNAQYVQPMSATANAGEFEWTGDMYEGGLFKFRLNGYESGDWTGFVASAADQLIANEQTYTILPSGGNPDYKFMVPKNSNYTITVNTYGDDKTMRVIDNTTLGIVAVANDTDSFALDGRTLSVYGNAQVYDIMGRIIAMPAPNATVTLPAGGVYIVVLNGKASRIAVQ